MCLLIQAGYLGDSLIRPYNKLKMSASTPQQYELVDMLYHIVHILRTTDNHTMMEYIDALSSPSLFGPAFNDVLDDLLSEESISNLLSELFDKNNLSEGREYLYTVLRSMSSSFTQQGLIDVLKEGV